jgi:hypothetical protein
MAQKADDQIEAGLQAQQRAYELLQEVKRRKDKPGKDDYVIASRWGDVDPNDPWFIGFVEDMDSSGRYLVHGRWYRHAYRLLNNEEGVTLLRFLQSVEGKSFPVISEDAMTIIYQDKKMVLEAYPHRWLLLFRDTGEIRGTEQMRYQSKEPRAADLNKLYAMRRMINMMIKEVKRNDR